MTEAQYDHLSAMNSHLVTIFKNWHEEGKLSFDWHNDEARQNHFRRLLRQDDLSMSKLPPDCLDWVASPHAWALYQAMLVKRGMK